LVDIHANPAHAMSAGGRAITPEKYAELILNMKRVAEAVGRA